MRVLITRPSHQQAQLIAGCQALGLETESLPCLEFEPLPVSDCQPMLESADLIVFTSRNAVEFAHRWQAMPWPGANVHGIGPATADALMAFGMTPQTAPVAPYTSEALLATLARDAQQRIVVVSGSHGRGVLESGLQAQGHQVDVIRCYTSRLPTADSLTRERVFEQNPPNIVVTTSDIILDNLLIIAGEAYRSSLLQLPITVNSPRAARRARTAGFTNDILVADPPGDAGHLEQLSRWLDVVRHASL